MEQERTILHSDLNSFYASVEMMLDPSLRGKAVAVCGSAEDRHGIVLAKSEKAKRAGVKTGMANWQAKQLCPDLILRRPRYEQYLKYSKLVRAIYSRYTNRIEPFGMDESWCDLTGCANIRDGFAAADEIRRTVKDELGLTVSIGVSFSKIFAKLGSDMKKPDAVTLITRENFREKVWPLHVSELLYVGPATTRKLAFYGIHTIGQLAGCDPSFLRRLFGVNGPTLWTYANGLDSSRVAPEGYEAPIKSIGHGATCCRDLVCEEDVWRVLLYLAQDVGRRLREDNFWAEGVQLFVRDCELGTRQYQTTLPFPTRSPRELAQSARKLFRANYVWRKNIRSVTIRAIRLTDTNLPRQLALFTDDNRREKLEKLDDAVDALRKRYGKNILYPASLMDGASVREIGQHLAVMPGLMYG